MEYMWKMVEQLGRHFQLLVANITGLPVASTSATIVSFAIILVPIVLGLALEFLLVRAGVRAGLDVITIDDLFLTIIQETDHILRRQARLRQPLTEAEIERLEEAGDIISHFLYTYGDENPSYFARYFARISIMRFMNSAELTAELNRVRHTLNTIRQILHNNTDIEPRQIRNQTVHDTATEASVKVAVERLSNRYRELLAIHTTLPENINFLHTKVSTLIELCKLIRDDERVINANFNQMQYLSEDNKHSISRLLSLVIHALNDKTAAEQMLNHAPSNDDIEDRWAGWFKSAIIDSQLAYFYDHGRTGYPTDEELNGYRSCFGGNLSRIITALEYIHPDVTIEFGTGSINNVANYAQAAEEARKKTLDYFCQNIINIAKRYLQSISAEILNTALQELKEIGGDIDSTSQIPPDKAPTLISLERDLNQYIIKEATQDLYPHGGATLTTAEQNTLKPFIEAYTDLQVGTLLDAIEEVIKEKNQNSSSSSSSQRRNSLQTKM